MAHEFECQQSGCDFMVRANDQDEVVNMVEQHAQNKHGMSMDRNDIESEIRQT